MVLRLLWVPGDRLSRAVTGTMVFVVIVLASQGVAMAGGADRFSLLPPGVLEERIEQRYGMSSESMIRHRMEQETERLAPWHEKADLDLDHPRLYYTAEQVETARARIEAGEIDWIREAYPEQAYEPPAGTEDWLDRSNEFIWRHTPQAFDRWFSSGRPRCPECNERIYRRTLSLDRPGEFHCPHEACGLVHPHDASTDEERDYFNRYWNTYVIDQYRTGAIDLAEAYALSGDTAYAEKAAELVDALATIYPLGRRLSRERLERRGYMAARHVPDYAHVYDLIADSGALDRPSPTNPGYTIRRNVAYNLLIHGADFCYRALEGDPWQTSLGNGAHAYLWAVVAVGSVLDVSEYVDRFLEPRHANNVYNFIYNNIDRDGYYYETSTSYSRSTKARYLRTAEILYHLRSDQYPEGINLYDHPHFRRAFLDAKWRQMMLGRVPVYGDTGTNDTLVTLEGSKRRGGRQWSHEIQSLMHLYARASDEQVRRRCAQSLYIAARADPNTLLSGRSLWHLANVGEVAGFDDSQPTVRYRGSEILGGGAGMAYLRSGEAPHERGVFMRYGVTLNHGHDEQMNIWLYGKGRELTLNPGRGNDHMRHSWAESAIAYNLVVADKQNPRSRGHGTLHLFAVSDDLSVVDVSNRHSYRTFLRYDPNHQSGRARNTPLRGERPVDLHRRMVALIDVSDEHSYVLDVFRTDAGTLRDYTFQGQGPEFDWSGPSLSEPQESGSLASPAYAWTEITNRGRIVGSGRESASRWVAPPGNGYGFLTSVQRADGNASFSASWSTPPDDDEPATLKLTQLGAPGRELIVAEGPRWRGWDVKHLLARDHGDRPSQYVSIIEPGEVVLDEVAAMPVDEQPSPGAALEPVAVRAAFQRGEETIHDRLLSSVRGQSFSAGPDERRMSTDAALAFVRTGPKGVELAKLVKGRKLISRELEVHIEDSVLEGDILEVDYEEMSLRVSGALPQGRVLAGEHLLVSHPDYAHNSPYAIDRVEREGAYSRVYLEDTDFLLARGRLNAEPQGDVLPNDVRLSYATRGNGSYFHGKKVVDAQEQAGTTITAVEDATALEVRDATGFRADEPIFIYDVKAGDTYRIPMAVSLKQTENEAGRLTYELHTRTSLSLSLPEETAHTASLKSADGAHQPLSSRRENGMIRFTIDVQDTRDGRATLVLQ